MLPVFKDLSLTKFCVVGEHREDVEVATDTSVGNMKKEERR